MNTIRPPILLAVGVRRTELETDLSPQFSAEVNNLIGIRTRHHSVRPTTQPRVATPIQ
jgi:hypothetical protein